MAKWSGNEKSWERQPKESLKAYEAFYLYLQMGDNRSHAKVAKELGKSITLINRWGSAWNWNQRSRDYDMELKRQELSARKAEIKKMQTRQMQTAVLLQKKAVEALQKIDPESMYAKDILRFIIDGAKLERELLAETETQAAKESGTSGESASLADTIISAYKRRMEDSGEC